MNGARRVWRVLMALWRFAKRHVPKWLVPVLAVVLVPVLRSREARGELVTSVKAAWRN